MELKEKILAFLYQQVEKNKLQYIRKGMVEDFERFILDLFQQQEAERSASRMMAERQSASESEGE